MFIGHSEDVHMKKRIQIFREKYEEEDFVKKTLRNLDACKEELLQSFSNYFRGLCFNILWIGYCCENPNTMADKRRECMDDKQPSGRG